MLTKKLKLLTISTLAILLIPVAPVLAEQGSGDSSSRSDSNTTTKTETHSNSTTEQHKSTALSTPKVEATDIAAKKIKACQNREASINNRMQNIASRGQKQLDLFTAISNRVEKFYTDKGLSLSNYDTLVAAVNAKKAAAQSTINQIKSDSVSFKCDGTDPKGEVTAFKNDLKNEISALKEYRTSVKNLTVGVKSVLNSTKERTNG